MRCSKCEFENPAGMKFCGKCRTALGLTCPNCSFENPPGFDFCGQCAAALHGDTGITKGKGAAAQAAGGVRIAPEQQTSEALEGERKTVTALFADIKGSTELMRDLDPEEARAIVDPALTLMMDAAHRYGGYVAQSTGAARRAERMSRDEDYALLVNELNGGSDGRFRCASSRSLFQSRQARL
jgi:hypothetical protein